MNSQLAYEIGAVFLLAALLMLGSVRGVGRFRLGGGSMAVLGAALAAFGVYHYWDQILALAAPAYSAAPVTAAPAPAFTPAAAKSAPVKHRSTPTPEPIEKMAVVEEVPPEHVAVPAPDKLPVYEKPETDTRSEPDPCAKSPYESRARRAMKSMGCGLHIIRKKQAQQP